jgi:hypothetical protein
LLAFIELEAAGISSPAMAGFGARLDGVTSLRA